MRTKLRKELERISMELIIIRAMVADLHTGLVPSKCSSINKIREANGLDPLPTTNEQLADAIRTLRDYCDDQDTCKSCVFKPCHTDSYECKIYQLIDSERYLEVLAE